MLTLPMNGPNAALTVVARDSKNNIVPIPSTDVPEWNVTPAGVGSMFPAPDGLSCELSPIAVGVCHVTVKDGSITSPPLDVTVTPAAIASLEIIVR